MGILPVRHGLHPMDVVRRVGLIELIAELFDARDHTFRLPSFSGSYFCLAERIDRASSARRSVVAFKELTSSSIEARSIALTHRLRISPPLNPFVTRSLAMMSRSASTRSIFGKW